MRLRHDRLCWWRAWRNERREDRDQETRRVVMVARQTERDARLLVKTIHENLDRVEGVLARSRGKADG